MILAHAGQQPAGPVPFAALTAAALYLAAVARAGRRSGRRWPRHRTAGFLTGCALSAAAVVAPVAPAADGFAGHTLQHVLLGMLAPLALVLGAPVALTLRVVGRGAARSLVRLLRSAPARVLTHPVTALLLSTGGLYLLYLTPLYRLSTAEPVLHHVVHAHFLLSGCLFAWSVAGPDPVPHRPSPLVRLAVLGVAVAAHAALAQLTYAGLFVDVPGSAGQRQAGATLMYYLGDLTEIGLALALLAGWRPGRRPAVPAGAAGPEGGRGPEPATR